jgi:hypothetical protein
MKKIILILLLISTARLYAFDISGRLLDERYFPVPKMKVFVSRGGSAVTDKNGEFKLTVDNTPYDLTIFDLATNIGVVYRNLSVANPEIFLFGSVTSKYANTEALRVNFPPVPNGKTDLIKFVSDEIFYSQDVIAYSGETTKLLSVDFPSSKKQINGRIIFMEKSPFSYEKFSERAVTIQKDYYLQTVIFDTLSTFSKPGDAYISLVLPVLDFDRKGFSVYANFMSLHRNAELLLNTTEGDIISTKVLVPQTIPFGYRLKIVGNGFDKGGIGFENFVYSYPNASYNLTSETPPKLEAPQDKLYTVNSNTLFSYDWGSGIGIYVVHFHCYDPVGDFYIVTNDRNIPSPISFAGSILKGTEFSWVVAKYLTYMSVDDYVKPRNYANDIGYKAILTSELRTFRTKFP